MGAGEARCLAGRRQDYSHRAAAPSQDLRLTSSVPTATPSRRRQSRRNDEQGARRTSTLDRGLIDASVAVAALAACFAPGEPTGVFVIDLVLRAGFAAIVTLAASRARRWTWIVLSGIAAVAASDGTTVAIGFVALIIAIAGSLMPRRRVLGAVSGALAVQVLLRLGELGFNGASVLATLAAVTPVLVSGYLLMPRRHRRLVQRSLLGAGAFVLGATVLFGISVLLAAEGVSSGISDVREGLELSGDGELPAATQYFDRGAESLERSAGFLGAWWAKPARAVPLLSQQARALEETTAAAADVADAATASARSGDFDTIRYEGGRIDLAQVRNAQQPLAEAVRSMDAAQATIDEVDNSWLLPPIRSRMESFDEELLSTRDEVFLASLAARELPGMLGGDGERRYLVMFIQSAETRGLGGFFGAWVELVAVNGEVDVVDSGKARELNLANGVPTSAACERMGDVRTITGVPDYTLRYDRFHPQCYIQDVPLSPDMPSVAEVTRQLYQQTRGVELDGVVAIDPIGLASLLEITGPVDVPGFDRRLTAEEAARFLLHDQYIDFDRNEDERDDFLEATLRVTFEELVEGDIPGPRKAGEILSPIAEGRHVKATMFREGEQEFILELGADGALPPPPDSDGFLLVTQNAANNKIDTYLQRTIDYDAEVDPYTGTLEATAAITLRNNAPSDGLPASIIGSERGIPPGTNLLYFNFYTPHRVTSAMLNGEDFLLEHQRELEWSVYTRFVEVPPGAEVTITLELRGQLERGLDYSLDIGRQPVPNPDMVSVDISFPSSVTIESAPGMAVLGEGYEVGTQFDQIAPRRLEVNLRDLV